MPRAKSFAGKENDRHPSDFVSCLQAKLAEGNLLLGLSFPADVPATALEAPNAQFQSILKVIHGSLSGAVTATAQCRGALASAEHRIRRAYDHVDSKGQLMNRSCHMAVSLLQVTGSSVPFEVEKQTALLGVLQSLTDGASNIAALNITAADGEPTTTFSTAAR